MPEPKFTSFTTADFLNDVDMDLFIDAVEKTAMGKGNEIAWLVEIQHEWFGTKVKSFGL